MKRKKFIGLMGVLTLALSVGANLQYAWNDYGVSTNSLHVEVLAQSSSSTGGGGTTGGQILFQKITRDCKYAGRVVAGHTVVLDIGLTIVADNSGYWEYKISRGEVDCIYGGNELCISQKCPNYQGRTT